MANMAVNICGVSFKNPIITASGTYGFGREFNEFFPLERLGGIACKAVTPEEKLGNPPPRVAETPSGMLNAVGLQNPGVNRFIREALPWLKKQNTVIIANVAGSSLEDYCQVATALEDTDVDFLELNISCPNVKEGGMQFGTSYEGVEAVTRAVRSHTSKPLMVKLSPNVTDIVDIAKAAENAGADCLSLINTLLGMRIDVRTRRPILHNNVGGLSGPAVFPVALRMVWQVASHVDLPVIGIGGVAKWQDAVEMMLAGATAVQIGTANFTHPDTPLKVLAGMEEYLESQHVNDVNDIIGTVKPW